MCVFSHACMTLFSRDLDLDPMTLIYKLDSDIPEMYRHTKNELSV